MAKQAAKGWDDMGWRDLFRSKTPATAPDLRIHWFGKLPDYADYYRSPSEQDWTVEFIDWMLKGYQIYKSRLDDQRSDQAVLPQCGLLLRLPKTRVTVFASIRDYGGDSRGRTFPFCLFAGAPTHDWPGPRSDGVGSTLRVIDDLKALHRVVEAHLATSERLDTLLGGRTLVLKSREEADEQPSWIDEARSLAMADWLMGLASDLTGENGQAWLQKTAAWGNDLADLDGKRADATLRVPLAAGIRQELQVSGWLRWLETRLDWSRRPLSLVMEIDSQTKAGSLVVLAKSLEGEDFLLATALAETLASLDDLGRAKQGGRAANPIPSLDLDNASWLDFVEQPRTLT